MRLLVILSVFFLNISNVYAENLERCIWKKELMLDANATSRKEMELTRIET